MRKIMEAKEQKGITLVVLVITIVVLLILSSVAITAIKKNGMIDRATEAKTKYDKSAINEDADLSKYAEELNKHGDSSSEESNNPWIKRGLAESVKYDKSYYGTGEKLENGLSISSMTIILDSTGGFSVTELAWNYSSAEVNEMISDGIFSVTSNSISFGGEIEWRFNSEGTQAKVYNIGRRCI